MIAEIYSFEDRFMSLLEDQRKENYAIVDYYLKLKMNKINESPKRDKEVARLFGDTVKRLRDGQFLRVRLDSVEGRDIAILEEIV